MTDRELLELAAKAAGINLQWMGGAVEVRDGIITAWNPLYDDGDALRLAVKLGIEARFTVSVVGGLGYVAACDANRLAGVGAEEKFFEDPYSATRRAIVRAAAEIGRNMK